MRPLGDITSLVESIREVGLLNPILITRGRKLISGLHRLEAFRALGLKHIPAIILSVTPTEAAIREIDENLARNDLTVLERAEHLLRRKELYEELHPEARQGGDHGNQYSGGKKCQKDNVSFCQTAATLTGQSSKTAQRLIRIAKLLTPKTKELLRGTEWADNRRVLTEICSLEPDMQSGVSEKLRSGKAARLRDAIGLIQGDRLRAKRCSLPMEGEQYRLLCGDFRKVGHEVASDSVDLVITDAPFERRDLGIFCPLSVFAQRVLKDGGSLLCMVGLYDLPKILNDLSTKLSYQWTIACVFGDGTGRAVHPRRIFNGYRVFLWFVKGAYDGRYVRDIVNGNGRDKSLHRHGQSELEFSQLIEKFTTSGDTVLDCFVGGGTAAAAALTLGRKFIGIDIEKKHIEITRRRIASIKLGWGD